MEEYDDDFDIEYFYGPDDEEDGLDEAILQPMDDEELAEIHARAAENHTGPLGRMYRCKERLERMNDVEIATSLKNVIDMMGHMGWDIVTFLHYLSWNLDIPPELVSLQSVIRCVVRLLLYNNIR